MSYGRVEVDGVLGFQKELLGGNLDGHGALQNTEEFASIMLVGLEFLRRDILKICQKGTQLSIRRPVIQALK
jgi:hypothetical protein